MGENKHFPEDHQITILKKEKNRIGISMCILYIFLYSVFCILCFIFCISNSLSVFVFVFVFCILQEGGLSWLQMTPTIEDHRCLLHNGSTIVLL